MKHLKPYKIFESDELSRRKLETQKDIDYVRDLLIDLVDLGFSVYVHYNWVQEPKNYSHGVTPSINILIKSKYEKLNLLPAEIGEYLVSVDIYLREMGWVGLENENAIVVAGLRNIDSEFKKEVGEFKEYLSDRIRSPFTEVRVKYKKKI